MTVEPELWERRDDGSIRAEITIYVERDNQKVIVLGKGGSMIKRIGQAARKEIEELLEENPKLAYRICLNNLDNKKTKIIATSYDTLEEMTIPEIMIFYARKKSAFTKEQMNKIYEEIMIREDICMVS